MFLPLFLVTSHVLCRQACRLDQDLKLEQKRSALLEKGKKQAEAAKAELEMRHQQQASDIASLHVELAALHSAFKTIQQQQQVSTISMLPCRHAHHQTSIHSAIPSGSIQRSLLELCKTRWSCWKCHSTFFICAFTVMCAILQTDHHAIRALSTDKPQQGLALVEARGPQACQDCVASQRAIADFRQRLEVLEANKAERDHKKAQSMPSTQDRSGDTNDDRYGRHGTSTTCSKCWDLSVSMSFCTHLSGFSKGTTVCRFAYKHCQSLCRLYPPHPLYRAK